MNRRTGLVLLFTIAVLGGLIYFLNVNPDVANKPTPTTAAEAPAGTALWTVDATKIEQFTIVDLTKQATFDAVTSNEGAWTINEPKASVTDAQTDQTLMRTYANTAAGLTFSRAIDSITSLTDFGLDKPVYTIEIKQTGTAVLKALIGKKTVTGDAYYVQVQGATQVVLVPISSLDTLLSLPAAPPYTTPTPVVTPLPTLPLPAPSPTP